MLTLKMNKHKNRARRRTVQTLCLQTLEGREMFSASASLTGSTLSLSADDGGSNFEVGNYDTGNYLHITAYDQQGGGNHWWFFQRSQVSEIRFYGSNTADYFNNRTDVPVTAFGFGGNDRLVGGDANDWIDGGNGHDYLDGGRGHDTASGGEGNDVVIGNYGNDALYGQAGHDQIYGGSDHDHMDGGTGDDYLDGYSGNDTLIGGYGNDKLYGRYGNDNLYGGSDHDYMDGGAGDDYLVAYSGVDTLMGGYGNDTMYGGNGNDKMFGGPGYDWLFGQDGDDFLDDGSGNEYVDGGNGYDYNAYRWTINGATYDDIYQGNLPKCGPLAQLSGAAHSGVDFAKRIQYLGNARYRVALFSAPGKLDYYDVTFNGDPDPKDDSRQNPSQSGVFWVTLIRRAVHERAKYTSSGNALVGREESRFSGPLTDTDWTRLENALHSKRTVIAAHGTHYRTVLGVRKDAPGQRVVDLRDPYGDDRAGGIWKQGANDGLMTITWNAFRGNEFIRYIVL